MFPIRFSTEETRQTLGWLAEKCPTCREVRAFLCHRSGRAWKIFAATIDERAVSMLAVCSVCRASLTLPVATRRVDTTWRQGDALQVLVDRTNPELGTVPARSEVSPQTVIELLNSLERQRPNFLELLENTSGRAVALGAAL